MSDKPVGYKADEGKLPYDLIAPEALEELAKVLQFGANKYTNTELRNFCNIVGATKISLYTPKDSVVHVTNDSFGLITLSTQSVNEKTGELGSVEILKKSEPWLSAGRLVPMQGKETSSLNDENGLKAWESATKIISNDWKEVVKFAGQQNTCTLITTTKRGNLEVYCAVSTTTVWDSLVITLKGLKPHSSISNLVPSTGQRNWEKGMAWSRVFAALQRHLWAWWKGDSKDPETGFSHLSHALCCLMFLSAYEARKVGQDDRPK